MKSDSHGRPKQKTVFVCQQCGKDSPKWLGCCPSCGAWNSFVETRGSLLHAPFSPLQHIENKAQELSKVENDESCRLDLGYVELNRVLGGGLVRGSLVLLGGEPGIGKSTLLLQTSAMVTENSGTVVYVSGEESISQVKLRAQRLNIVGNRLYFLCETDLDIILECLEELSPSLVAIDSIQTMHLESAAGAPGSVAQVRECTLRLMYWAKQSNIPVFIAGHVTKDGSIAGPGVLEHIVDVVLYFEGESLSNYRVLRGVKNRFGSTNEIGIFEMSSKGLIEVDNPSQVFLSEHNDAAPGSVVVSIIEGSRPLLVEIQALTTSASFGPPRRIANGVDLNRLFLIAAVLSKRAGLKLANQDIIVNVTGGLRVTEPGVDLGIGLAIASSLHNDKPIAKLVALGEIGLNGEIRPVPQLERRIGEAARLGFKSCLMPKLSSALAAAIKQSPNCAGVQLLEAVSLTEALHLGLSKSG